MRGIYYNSIQASCSIWESGMMVYNILKQSDQYTLNYTEDQTWQPDYDFAIVNWHFITNKWINDDLLSQVNFKGPIFCVITEVGLTTDTLFIQTPKSIFSAYIFLDPSLEDNPMQGIYGFPRPLEKQIETHASKPGPPIIGSFGYPTPGKLWLELITAVELEFDDAIIRLNIPKGTFIPFNKFKAEIDIIRARAKTMKPGIQLQITHNYMTKPELIDWCAENTINCFFYDRYKLGFTHGLCAVSDQAISSGRPLLTSSDLTFKHLLPYIKPWPEQTIKSAIESTPDSVKQLQQLWSPKMFLSKFEKLFANYFYG
jgi:hypothetical protein